jgi:hypothetical protein
MTGRWRSDGSSKATTSAAGLAADINRNGLISTTGLATYLNRRVPTLTDGKQTPGMEVRFDTTVFAVGQ